MKKKEKWSPEVVEFSNATANALLESITGTKTHVDDVAVSLQTALLTQFDNTELLTNIVGQYCRSVVEVHVNSKAQEKNEEEQGDWLEDNFSNEYLKALLKLDGGFICRNEDAHWDMLTARRNRQKKHEDEAKAKRKKSDERLQLLSSVGMDVDPEMTLRQAVRLLSEMKENRV